MANDFELLDAWAAGDNDAARQLLQRYTAPLYRFFDNKVHGPIEDMVQDTLLACIEGRDRIRRDAGFRAYMFGTARHILFAHLRKKHRDGGEIDLESSSLQQIGPTASQMLGEKKEQQILLQALRHLPVDTQVLFELYHWQNLSAREIGDLLGLGEPAVRGRLRRARELLRVAVEELAASPALLHSTWADFEKWAAALPSLDDDDAKSE